MHLGLWFSLGLMVFLWVYVILMFYCVCVYDYMKEEKYASHKQ